MTVSVALLVTTGKKGIEKWCDSSFWKNITCYLSVNFFGGVE